MTSKRRRRLALAGDGSRGKAWLGVLGLATVTALAVFAAVRAAGADTVAGPVALVVLLLGAVSAVLLYRAGERSPPGGAAAASADNDKNPTQAAYLGAERDRLADLLDGRFQSQVHQAGGGGGKRTRRGYW